MGHQRRYYKHHDVLFVSNRLAEGLPFVPNIFINSLLLGALARAAALSPGIVICAFSFMQNHYHLIVYIKDDGAEMSTFLHDLDDESAKVIKKLLGKRNLKVWAQRPHVALLGDVPTVIKYFAYCFLNPVDAGFCARAAEWIGVNSYETLFNRKLRSREHKWVGTKELRILPNKEFTDKEIRQLNSQWENTQGVIFELQIEPFIWKERFDSSRLLTDAQVLETILAAVEAGEKDCMQKRKKEKQQLSDPELLRRQNPYKRYRPKKYGRRVYCICTDPDLRKQIIEAYKDFCEQCKAAWAAWKKGDFSVKYPPGAFLPPRLPLASALPGFL